MNLHVYISFIFGLSLKVKKLQLWRYQYSHFLAEQALTDDWHPEDALRMPWAAAVVAWEVVVTPVVLPATDAMLHSFPLQSGTGMFLSTWNKWRSTCVSLSSISFSVSIFWRCVQNMYKSFAGPTWCTKGLTFGNDLKKNS